MGGGFYSYADKNKDDDSDGKKKSVDELKSSISEKEGKINNLENFMQ